MAGCVMTESAADPRPKRRWCQFHLWHLFLLVTVVAFACASIKYLIDFRVAKTNFYDAIQSNGLSEVQALLRRYPSLIRTAKDRETGHVSRRFDFWLVVSVVRSSLLWVAKNA